MCSRQLTYEGALKCLHAVRKRYLGGAPYSRIGAHVKFASVLAALRSRERLNNVDITYALAVLLECDEEVAEKLKVMLRALKMLKAGTRVEGSE